MEDSILTSTKFDLGITDESYEDFDSQIIAHINTAFFVLHQIGVGPEKPFSIKDKTATWHDFSDKIEEMEPVKTYVFKKVKKVFDPPASGAAINALNEVIAELESRLNYYADY